MTPRTVTAPSAEELAAAFDLVETIPDYPKPGVTFLDVLPIFANPQAFEIVLREMLAPFNGRYDYVAGAEARGFLIAGAAASYVGCGLVPIRKAGKLPRPAASESYDLEYGSATLEMQHDIPAGSRVLILDDVLATGGTVAASAALTQRLGYRVAGIAVLLEIAALKGRSRLDGVQVHAASAS